MRKLRVAVGILVASSSSTFATLIHHWRFEDSPGLLEDSAGGQALTSTGSPMQAALPTEGRGSSFRAVGNDNTSAVDLSGDILSAPSLSLDNFTVEVLANADLLSGTFGHSLSGNADSQGNVDIGWLLQMRGGQLTMFLGEGTAYDLLYSGISVGVGIDYYFGAAVDLAGGEVTFYAKDLSNDGDLETTVLAHSRTSLTSTDNFVIGATASGDLPFNGLIDEVLISDTVLGIDDLYIVPEPSVAQLLAFAGAVLFAGFRRRRFAQR